MKVYVKSAGRQATQDYVWKTVEAFGADDKIDRENLSIAERSTANKGRVASFVGDAGEPPYRFALFFGNIDSGRCDFYGTPILNRIGFVFEGEDGDDVRLAHNLASDWYSVSSALERQIATGIIASDDEVGFALSPDFAEVIRRIASSPTVENLRPDADQGLFESIARMHSLSYSSRKSIGLSHVLGGVFLAVCAVLMFRGCGGTLEESRGKDSASSISTNAVSGTAIK